MLHHGGPMESLVHFVMAYSAAYSAQTVTNSVSGLFRNNRGGNDWLFINLSCNTLTKDWVLYTRTVIK